MKKITCVCICFLIFFVLQSQEIYFTTAKSGLIIRKEPNITSKRIGKLPYGSTVKVLEKTELKHQFTNNGKVVKGTWVKVEFQNFPYIISVRKAYEDIREGYVFDPYIEKLNKPIRITSKQIDSIQFYKLYKEPAPLKLLKITSQKEAEKQLGSKVRWKNIEYLGRTVDQIFLENGQVLNINQRSNDYNFVAYYPTEDILLFEGGHTSDFSISVKTGESLHTTGNPDYIYDSPNKKMRLNGWFPGQECSSYFLQKKTGTSYTYLTDFGFGSNRFGENVCYFNIFYWVNDQEFMYSYTEYIDQKPIEKYVSCHIGK